MLVSIGTLTLQPHDVRGEPVCRDGERSIPVVFLTCHHLYICPGRGQILFFSHRKQLNTLTYVRTMVTGNLWWETGELLKDTDKSPLWIGLNLSENKPILMPEKILFMCKKDHLLVL